MRTLQAKLNSRRGASLLLALLFFLIALLVGASVLMAAASNGGKLKSNVDEQQAYLTLSSAMQLVVDELDGSTYSGKYLYSWTTRTQGWATYYYYSYNQQEGDRSSHFLDPFILELDREFSTECGKVPADSWRREYRWYERDFSGVMTLPKTQVFTLTVAEDLNGTGADYSAITGETVEIKLELDPQLKITATVTIKDGDFKDYSMVADFNPGYQTVSNPLPTGTNGAELSLPYLEWTLTQVKERWS